MRKKAQAEKLSSNMVLQINQKGWGESELECQLSGKKKQNILEAWRESWKRQNKTKMGPNATIHPEVKQKENDWIQSMIFPNPISKSTYPTRKDGWTFDNRYFSWTKSVCITSAHMVSEFSICKPRCREKKRARLDEMVKLECFIINHIWLK